MPLPLYPDLPISRPPWITLGIILLCLLIHLLNVLNQAHNYDLAEEIAEGYKQELVDSIPATLSADQNAEAIEAISYLGEFAFYVYDLPYLRDDLDEHLGSDDEIFQDWPEEDIQAFMIPYLGAIDRVVDEMNVEGRFSYERAFIAHQEHFSPWRWITSSLLHGDWGHVIFNMIFFFAFGFLVETIINSTRRYLLHMTVIALVVGLADYLLHLNTQGVYTLGFSGVVMGIIGMAAFLAPRARIRTLQFIGPFYARNFSIPAWILAVFFIGGDIYTMSVADDTYGINVFAHVVGGISGYLLAYFFLQDRKEDIQEELEDAIELRRAERADKLGNLSSAATNMSKSLGEDLVRQDQKEFERRMAELYRLVETRQYPMGTIVMLDIVEDYTLMDLGRLVELFDRIKLWEPNPTALNLARLVINSAMANKRFDVAISTALWALKITPHFVLADPVNLPTLSAHLMQNHHDDAVRLLLTDFERKYAGYGDTAAMKRILQTINTTR